MRIHRKVPLITISVLLVVMLAGSTLSILNFRDNYRDALLTGTQGAGYGLHGTVSDLLALGLPLESLDGMDQRLARMLKDHPHLGYVGITDPRGRVLFHSDPKLIGRLFDDPVMRRAIATEEPLVQLYDRFDGHSYYDFSLPIPAPSGERLGQIRLGFDTGIIRDKVIAAAWQSAAIFIASFLLIALLINLLLSRLVTQRIAKLAVMAGQIAEGRFEATAPSAGNDEIDALAGSLAQMAQRLQSQIRQLQQTQFAMDRVGIAIHWVDVGSGRLLDVNDQACAMLGYRREELLRLEIPDLDPNFPPGQFAERTAPLRERGQGRFETLNRRKDGQTLPVEVTLYFQPADSVTGDRFISFITDISQRKQAEAELIQAKETAESANRAKSVFLANMSHELRTPLNAILGFAQLMERNGRIPEEERRNLATINRSGKHLLDLINDVLEISRIEAGRSTVVNAPFDLAGTLTAVEEMIRLRAQSKELAFSVERPADLPPFVLGDAHRLRQVLINLLGNAVKYTDRGRIGLSVATLLDGRLRFAVSDSGPGIAPEEQQAVFRAFYQTENGIAKGEGTGLGLTISQEFVRLMGGEIRLDSTPDQGSRFCFDLPLPPSAAIPRASGGPRIIGLADDQPAPRILVAEDQPDNQQVVAQLLTPIGFQVRIARHGREAVALFQDWHPQLILMDMRMPVMDGYAATRAIRALPGGDRLPIVALTASAFEEDRGLVLAAGCDDLVRKPVEEGLLLELIGHRLGLRFRYREAIEAAPMPQHLGKLSPEWRQELEQASTLLDIEGIQAIVERLRPQHPAEAELIASLAEEFRFDQLMDLCADRG